MSILSVFGGMSECDSKLSPNSMHSFIVCFVMNGDNSFFSAFSLTVFVLAKYDLYSILTFALPIGNAYFVCPLLQMQTLKLKGFIIRDSKRVGTVPD